MLKILRGAADFSPPPRDYPLWKLANLIFTPRISSLKKQKHALPYSLHKHELHSGILMPHPHRLYTAEPCH